MIMLSNGNGQEPVPVSPECALRREVFSLLGKSKTSVQQDLKILSQCVSHLRNTALIEKAARASKLKISGFRVNDALELYYDIKRGRSEMATSPRGGKILVSGSATCSWCPDRRLVASRRASARYESPVR